MDHGTFAQGINGLVTPHQCLVLVSSMDVASPVLAFSAVQRVRTQASATSGHCTARSKIADSFYPQAMRTSRPGIPNGMVAERYVLHRPSLATREHNTHKTPGSLSMRPRERSSRIGPFQCFPFSALCCTGRAALVCALNRCFRVGIPCTRPAFPWNNAFWLPRRQFFTKLISGRC